MTHVMVLGASFAGLDAAKELRRLFGDSARVTVVDHSDRFIFRPSLPWLALGQRRPEQITVPLRPFLAKHGVEFARERVVAIDPKENTVWTTGGRCSYDFLVIALGGTSPPDIPAQFRTYGLSGMWMEDTLQLRRALMAFQGGHVVVALCPRSPLVCAAYEWIFQIDRFLSQRGLRRFSRLSLVTYEEQVYGVGGPRASRIVQEWMERNGMGLYLSTFVEGAGPERVVLADGTVLPAGLFLFVPAYSGPGPVKSVPGLTDADGFVLTDRYMRSHVYNNIFAAGDGVAFPGTKTGLMAEMQARVAARNIAAEYNLHERVEYTSLLACLTDLGLTRGLLSVRKPAPQQGSVRTYLTWSGWGPHLAKIGFEKYYMGMRLQ